MNHRVVVVAYRVYLVVLASLIAFPSAQAQISIPANSLVLRSFSSSGSQYTHQGYFGTYLTVPAGGSNVSLTAAASSGGANANLTIAVADRRFDFNVGSTAANYTTPTFNLPGGTYLVRAERGFNNGVNQQFTLNTLSVTGVAGTTFSNVANSGGTAAQANANAINASNTYIQNFRRGALNLSTPGATPGQSARVRLVNSEFKWGTAVPSSMSTFLRANPTPGSREATYQQLLTANFNSITPENGGKWSESDTPTQLAQNTDRMLRFAADNDIRVRQHAMLWSTQQPTRINDLFTSARSTNPAISGPAKASIQAEIDQRISRYLSADQTQAATPTARARGYDDLDVLNESYNTGQNADVATNANYWKVLGATQADGPNVAASIYNRTQTAVDDAGANTRLFVNDYNILNWSGDQYAQFYNSHIKSIRDAGGSVGGIGVQFYASPAVGTASAAVNPWRINATLANLSTHDLPIELTEFGTTTGGDPAAALEAAMRAVFGNPDATGFTVWGFYQDRPNMFSGSIGSVHYDTNFNITPTGQRYQQLRAAWTTDATVSVGADGSIILPETAFFGDYELTLGGQTYRFTHTLGGGPIVVPVPEPSTMALLAAVGLLALLRKRRIFPFGMRCDLGA